jgi:hypothetical protein
VLHVGGSTGPRQMPSVRRLGAPDTGSSSNKEEMQVGALEEQGGRERWKCFTKRNTSKEVGLQFGFDNSCDVGCRLLVAAKLTLRRQQQRSRPARTKDVSANATATLYRWTGTSTGTSAPCTGGPVPAPVPVPVGVAAREA